MTELAHIPRCQPPWKWRAQIKNILRQLRTEAGSALTRADLADLNVTLEQPESSGSADIEKRMKIIHKTYRGKRLLKRLYYSKAIHLDYREKGIDAVVCGYLKLLARKISGYGGKLLSESLPKNRNKPLKLRLPPQEGYIRHQPKVLKYSCLTSRCMGYKHRRGEPIGILSLRLPSHPGENRVSALELFCLTVTAAEQLYLARNAKSIPSFFTVRVLSSSKSNPNLYRMIKAKIPASYLHSLLDIRPTSPSKRLQGSVKIDQSCYFDMFVPEGLQKLMGVVFKE